MDMYFHTGMMVPDTSWYERSQVLRIRGGAREEELSSTPTPSSNPRKRKSTCVSGETHAEAMSRHLDYQDEIYEDIKAELITMLEKTRIGKKWQDSILDPVDKLVITTRGVYIEASELIGESSALHSVLASSRKDNERLSSEIGALREKASFLQAIPKASHPSSVADSCKNPLQTIEVELRAAVRALTDATETKLAKDKKRRKQGSDFQLRMLTPDSAVVVNHHGPSTSGAQPEIIDLMDVVMSDSEPSNKALSSYASATKNRPVKERIETKIRPTPTPTPKRKKSNRDSKMTRVKRLPS